MSNWAEIYGGFFTRALKLYPREFRAEFGDEMSAVFTQAIEAHAGTGKTLRYFLRELKGNHPLCRSPSTRIISEVQ